MSDLYEHAIRNELAYWPGVDVEFGKRSKHREARLHFGGTTRFVVYPDSPSDGARGHLNCISNVRQELATLGAQRVSAKPKKRKRGPRVIGNQMPRRPEWASRIDKAPAKESPWAALASCVPPEPTLWDRIKAFVRRIAA